MESNLKVMYHSIGPFNLCLNGCNLEIFRGRIIKKTWFQRCNVTKESQGTLQKAIYKREPVTQLNTATRRMWAGRKSGEQCNEMYESGLYTLSTTTETRAGDGELKKGGKHERVHMAASKQECVYVCN